METVLIRVDASPVMGGGHLTRCLALAAALRDQGFGVHIATAFKSVVTMLPSTYASTLIAQEAASQGDCQATLALIKQLSPVFLVLDGYHFDSHYHEVLSQHCPLLVIDDENNRGCLYADILVSPTAGITARQYEQTAAGTKLLLGNEYVLISPQFLTVRKQPIAERKRLMICFGAADVQQYTLSLVELLAEYSEEIDPAQVDIVCGNFCSQPEAVEKACQRYGFKYWHNHTDMPALMQESRVAVAAPGTLLYELAFSAVPAVFVLAAENQRASARFHQQLGWCELLAMHCDPADIINTLLPLWNDEARHLQMAQLAAEQVDGLGAARIARQLRLLLKAGARQLYVS